MCYQRLSSSVPLVPSSVFSNIYLSFLDNTTVRGNYTMYPFRYGNNCCDGINQRNQEVLTENIFNIQHSTLGKIQYSFTYNHK
jgi:hypothetical protein